MLTGRSSTMTSQQFRAYSTSWRTLCQPHKILPGVSIRWCSNWVSEGCFTILPSDRLSRVRETMARPVNVVSTACWSKVRFYDRSNVVWNSMKVSKTFYNPHMDFSEAFYVKKANSHANCHFNENKVPSLPNGCGPVQSTCQQMTACFPQKVVTNPGLSIGLFCWHVGHIGVATTSQPCWLEAHTAEHG